jgi:AraC family transcriptional activator of pobA
MKTPAPIPVFTLFGEHDSFPDVVHCERIHARAGLTDWVISPHRHDQMVQIFQIESGAAKAQIDGATLHLSAGNFLYIPNKFVHGFDFEQGTEGLVLSFPLPILASLAPQTPALAQTLSTPITGQVAKGMSQLMIQLSAHFETIGTFRTQRLVALSHAILTEVAEVGADTTAPSAGHQTLEQLNMLLQQHLNDGWHPCDFASALSITTGHLSRICRRTTGQSASSYIETAVMTEASRLLAFTRLSVAEVGYRLGYNDPPYFSRRFRKTCGQTPSAYRARFLTHTIPDDESTKR